MNLSAFLHTSLYEDHGMSIMGKQGKAEPEEPKQLAEDLAALYAPDLPVPPDVDRAIIATARERFARRRRPRLVLRWAPVGALAAAAAIVLFLVPTLLLKPRHQASRERAVTAKIAAKEDIDQDGRVDILDAFALARHIESSREFFGEWDMNGDGSVDDTDVEVIARAAVSLERSSVQ